MRDHASEFDRNFDYFFGNLAGFPWGAGVLLNDSVLIPFFTSDSTPITIATVSLDSSDWHLNVVPRTTSTGFVILRTEVAWDVDGFGNEYFSPGSSSSTQDIIWQSSIPANASSTFYLPLFAIGPNNDIIPLAWPLGDQTASPYINISPELGLTINVAAIPSHVPTISYDPYLF